MKGDECYNDLDEFWVVGDFVADVFIGWDDETHRYVDFRYPSRAERFSTYMEARKFMKHNEDAAEWVKEHGGSRFVKPLRCRKSVVVYPPGVRP